MTKSFTNFLCFAFGTASLVAALSVEQPDPLPSSSETSFSAVARQLGLADDWAITLLSAMQADSEATLEYAHGSMGGPDFKIYGGDFDGTIDLVGSTCRSSGGLLQDPQVGLMMNPTFGVSESSLTIAIDTGAIQDNAAIYRASPDSGTEYIVQFCVCFSLINAANEEANFVETEIRFVQSQDGALLVSSVGPFTTRTPETLQVVTSSGLTAEICLLPEAQGDVVSICITKPDNAAMQISTVDSFMFKMLKTGDESVTQTAFVDGIPSSLTEIYNDDGASFVFDTILKAEFYTSESSDVIGKGNCTLANGRRALLQLQAPEAGNQPSEPDLDNEIINLAFTIGGVKEPVTEAPEASSTVTYVEPPSGGSALDPNTTMFVMVIVVLAVLLGVSLVALTAVSLLCLFQKKPFPKDTQDPDESMHADELMESVPADELNGVTGLGWF